MHVTDTNVCKMSDKPEKNDESPEVTQSKLESKSEETLVSKEKTPSKDNYYIKKRIIAAINRSFKSNNNNIKHTFSVSDDEKNDSKNGQSITIIVKKIDFDKESILYTQENGIPEIINLEDFKIKEISGTNDLRHGTNDFKHDTSESKRNTNDLKHSTNDTKKNSTNDSKHNASDTKHGTSDLKHNTNSAKHGTSDSRSSRTKHNTSDSKYSSNITKCSASDSKHNSHYSTERKRSSDDRSHRSDKRHSNSHRSDKSKKYYISEETIKSPYLLCYSCGRKEEKKWIHTDCKNKCCRSTAYYCDSCLKYKIIKNDYYNDIIRNVTFGKYMYVVKCPNGRGCSLHMDYERIMHLRSAEQREVATEFLKQAFKEDDQGYAQFTIAIVHNGARYMPDMLKLMVKSYPTLKVNTTKIKSSTETELTDLSTYYRKVKESYNNGTFSHDPLNETQAACVKNADEYGAYLPEMLSLLEKSPFLSQVLPWGEMTTKRFKTPHESDDGPIFWCRPGEQIISLDRNSQRNRWNATEIETFLQERKKNMLQSEKKLIVEELKKYRRSYSTREFLFEDRTRPHADQAWGNSFEATAAVGVIQAIHPDEHPDYNRTCKEIVVFHAKHIEMLEALLHIDMTAAPKQQCAEWLDDAKLNMIRQMKIEFSKLLLRDNDIYFIPRKIVHQFKTISATLSIAWHCRLQEYYKECDAASETKLVIEESSRSEKVPKKTKNSHSRSRCNSTESRDREYNRRASKRKHKSRKSRSPNKKLKQESRSNCHTANNTAIKKIETVKDECGKMTDIDSVKLEPRDDIGNDDAVVEVKIEPNVESKNTSISLYCPRVEIVDIKTRLQNDGVLKCDNGLTIDINDTEMRLVEDETKSNTSPKVPQEVSQTVPEEPNRLND